MPPQSDSLAQLLRHQLGAPGSGLHWPVPPELRGWTPADWKAEPELQELGARLGARGAVSPDWIPLARSLENPAGHELRALLTLRGLWRRSPGPRGCTESERRWALAALRDLAEEGHVTAQAQICAHLISSPAPDEREEGGAWALLARTGAAHVQPGDEPWTRRARASLRLSALLLDVNEVARALATSGLTEDRTQAQLDRIMDAHIAEYPHETALARAVAQLALLRHLPPEERQLQRQSAHYALISLTEVSHLRASARQTLAWLHLQRPGAAWLLAAAEAGRAALIRRSEAQRDRRERGRCPAVPEGH